MKDVIGILKASVPVMIGVFAGMVAYEQYTKAKTKIGA